MTPEETLRQALLEDKFPESDEKPIVPIADPLKYNRMTAVSVWMNNLTGQDISPEDIGWPAEKDALAQEFFKMPDAKDVSDETIHDLIRSHIQTSDNAKRIAFSSASSGRSITQALNEVDSVAGVSKTRGIRDRYLNEASTIYGNVATNLAPYRTIIDQAAKTIEGFDTKAEGASDAFTQIAESLLPLPPKERLMVISAIGEVGAATPKDQQAYLLKLVLAMDREAEKAVTGTASLAESLFFAGGAVEMSTMNVPGIAKATAEYAQKRRELQVLSGQVKMMAQSKINPIAGGNAWEETGIGVARMAPLLVATMANSPAAIAVMTGQFRDEATVEAVNAGESLDNAEAIASIAAPIMAGQEFLSNALPLGKIKIPFIDKWLKASTTSIKSAALRVATRGTIGTGAEITEEIMQTVTPLLTQDLLSDWQSEWSIESGISKSDWDERMPKISDIAKGTFGPAFVISFLMAGRISISDVKNSRALMTSPDYMIRSGIAPDLANQIAAEGLKGNYNEVDALFRKGFDKGNQATPEQIKEAESKIDVKASNSLEYYNKLRKEFGVGPVSNIGNGKYQFTTPILKDGKGEIIDSGISAQFNSISEANEAQMLHLKNRQISIRKAEQELITSMNASLEEKQGLDIALMDFDMFTKTFTELFPSTSAQVEERIKLSDQIDGAVEEVSLENATLESEANDNKNYRILGTNSIEQREGISVGVITIYNGGGLLDVIEENAEIGVKRLMSDPTSRTKLILQIRDVEAKMKERAMQMGQRHMPLIATGDDNQVSNMEIIEAFSHIAKSYYVQTAKAVERPTFTSDMPLNLYLGSLQSSIAGMELKDAIDLVGEKTLNILYRASQIKAVYDANGLNQDFVDALEKSVGLNVSNRNADGVVDTAAGLAADAGVSMSTTMSMAIASPEDIAYNESIRVAPTSLMERVANRDGVGINDNILYRKDRAYRFIGAEGLADLRESGLVRAKQNTKQAYEGAVFMSGKSSGRYADTHMIELIPDNTWTGDKYITPSNNLAINDIPHRIYERNADGSYSVIEDTIGDQALLNDAGVSMSMGRVTPEQDAEYLDLAKDPEKNRTLLQRMVDAVAKAAGFTTEGWHYSGEKFNEFDIFTARTSSDIQGFFFKNKKDKYKEYGPIEYKVAIKLQNPANRAALMSGFSPGSTNDAGIKQREKLIEQGYDGVIISEEEGEMDYAEIIAFDPAQIKSADPVTYDADGNIIPLSQRFNEATPDINFSMGSAQPYKDRSGEDASSPLTDTEIREGIEDEQGTQAESPIDIADLSEVLDDPSLPDIPWGDSMTSFSMAPGLSPWKQITREDLKKAGKKAFAFYADRMRVGTYSGIDPSSGINIPLQGGFDFPAQNEMIENDIAWAVSDEKTVKSMITSAIRTGGHAIIALFSRGNVTGNATFLQAYFEELRWNIKQGKITEQQALDFFHEAKQSAGVKNNAIPSAKGTTDKATGEKIPPTPERVKEVEEKREAFAKLKWTSLDEVERVLGSLSFKLRGSGFFKTTLNENAKRGVHIAAGIMGKQELVNAGMPDVAKMVELMEEPNFTNLPLGTIVGIVQIDPDQKVQTAVQMGVTPHKSYPYVVRGKRVGVFKKEHHIEDFIPLKPKSSRIMEGEAMAATISFSMEKANRKDSLRVLLTKKALTDAALAQASWKDWYSEHKETLDEFFGDSAELFQKILSVTSQASSVKANVGLALKAFGQLMRNENFDGKLRGEAKSGYLPAVISNLNAIKDNLAAKGRKISNYTAANEGDLSRVVVDRHIARLLFGVDTPSKSQYDKAEKLLTKIGNEIGWSPSQVQAALWAHSIVQSGETPESYGAYLKKLESKPLTRKELKNGLIGNQLTRRIGNITRGGNGLPSIGTGRGRYSSTSPTFSISRSDFTGRIEQSLRPIFEGSPEAKLKIGMMALKRAQAVAAESLYDVGRAGAAKRKLAEMEASRIKKLGKVTDKTPDWVKKSLEKETTPEQAKAALMKDKLNGWIQMHDAIVSSMPTEIRGTIGSISTLAKLSSDEARLRFIEDRIPKVEKAIEKYLKKGYGERIDKMLEAAAVKGKAGEIPKSKFIVTVQDELNTIIEMTNLSTDDTVKEAARYEAEIISAQTAEDAADAFAKAQLLEVFGDLYGKQTTAEEMDVAHEYLKDLMKQGRAARKVLDEARAAEVAAMVKQAKSDAFAGAANAATVQAGKDKGKGTTKGMLKGLLRELGSHRFVLSSVFGRSNKTADHFDEQMILGVNAFETKQAERKKSLRDFMRTLYGTKSKIRLDIELEKMETRVERSGVTKMEGEKRESDTKTVEEVERIIKSPSTFGYSAEEAQIWEDEMDAWSNLPTSRKRNLTIERIKVKGTRIEIPLSQMEAVYMAMALRQPGILDQQTVHGYDLITQAELDDFMSDKSKNWLAWFGAEYANEYDAANEVFMKLFNTRMPQIQFYAPLLKNHQGNQAALDPLNSNVVSQSVNPGATKSRRGRTSSLRIESALGVYQSHFVQMDYWINMAEHLRDTQAVMLNPEVRAAIQSEHGDEAMQALSSWVQLEMARGVSKGALVMHSSRMMRNIKSGVAMKALAFNIGTSIKTLSSVFYSLGEIPITRWPVAFARGIQHWGRMWDTNIIQNRLELGGTPEIRHILANRGKAPNMVLRLIENALVYGSTPTQYADAVLTSYSAAMVYGDRLAQAEKAGAGDEAAHKYAAREMEIAVSRTAQPNDWSGRSLIENDVSGVFNLLSMFSSDPRQKLGLVGEAIMKRQRGGATNEEVARKVLAYWVIPGLMFQVANAVTRSMFKDDDKEWEVDNFIRAALVGPLQGLFLLGAAAEFFIASAVAYAAEKITGEEQDKPRNWRSSTNPLVDISDQFLKSIQKLPEKIEEEDFLGGAWEIMKAGGALSTPFSPAGAAPGVADRVFKDTTTLFYGKEED